jgi:hypothetical protein
MAQGMDPGEINAMRKAAKAAQFEVWEENWQALQVFLQCQTQWRVSMGGLIGLDYAAVAWVLKLYEIDDQRSTLEKLQVIEAAVLQVLNK